MTTAMASLGVAIAPVAFGLAAIASLGPAAYSAFTGKDNFISEGFQKIGLVPELTHDTAGHPTGYADPALNKALNQKDYPAAPNAKEAEARRINFRGLLNIAGAPPGSTFTSTTQGGPSIQTFMLGANP
jgi:hypothetical protein